MHEFHETATDIDPHYCYTCQIHFYPPVHEVADALRQYNASRKIIKQPTKPDTKPTKRAL